MIGGGQPRAIYRINDSTFMPIGITHVSPVRILSPTGMKSSMMPTVTPLRPLSSGEQQRTTETSQNSSPYKTRQTEPSEPQKPRKPAGLNLVDKSRKKKPNPEPGPSEYQNLTWQLQQEVERTRLQSDPTADLRKENSRLQAESAHLRDQFQKKALEEKAVNEDRIRKMQIAQQQRYTQLLRRLTQSEKEKEHMRSRIGQLESEVKRTKEENFRLTKRFAEVMQIGQRVQQVEFHCKNLEMQLEKDADEWKHQKRKLEHLNS